MKDRANPAGLHLVAPEASKPPAEGIRVLSSAELLIECGQAFKDINDNVRQLAAWADVYRVSGEHRQTRVMLEGLWRDMVNGILEECRALAGVFERTLDSQSGDSQDTLPSRAQVIDIQGLLKEVSDTLSPDTVDQSGIDTLKRLASALPRA